MYVLLHLPNICWQPYRACNQRVHDRIEPYEYIFSQCGTTILHCGILASLDVSDAFVQQLLRMQGQEKGTSFGLRMSSGKYATFIASLTSLGSPSAAPLTRTSSPKCGKLRRKRNTGSVPSLLCNFSATTCVFREIAVRTGFWIVSEYIADTKSSYVDEEQHPGFIY